MHGKKLAHKGVVLLAAVAATIGLVAPPASAAGPYSVTGSCGIAIEPTPTGQAYVVSGYAVSSSTNVSVPTSTDITCFVINQYGSIMDLFRSDWTGPVAPVAGAGTMSDGWYLHTCVDLYATFSDGGSLSRSTC